MCCSRISDARPAGPERGFSLVEVLVAFVLAAIMGMTFLAAQRGAFDMAERARIGWKQLNAAQSFFIERPLSTLVETRSAWIAMSGDADVEWSLEVTPDVMDIDPALLIRPGARHKGDEEDEEAEEDGQKEQSEAKRLEPPVLDLIRLRTRLDGALLEWSWYGGGRDAAP